MNRDTLAYHLFNGQSSEEFTANLIFGLIGLIMSILAELIRTNEKIKARGGFSAVRWLQDNYLRSLFSIVIIIVGAMFGDDILGKIGVWGCIGLGFITDKLIEALIKFRRTINFDFNKLFKKNDSTGNTI